MNKYEEYLGALSQLIPFFRESILESLKEHFVNKISPKHSELSGKAKYCAIYTEMVAHLKPVIADPILMNSFLLDSFILERMLRDLTDEKVLTDFRAACKGILDTCTDDEVSSILGRAADSMVDRYTFRRITFK